MTKFLEVTQKNEREYLDQIATLENVVLDKMVQEGRVGQLFTTGKEDISKYIHSDENTVMVAVDENNNVKAATYITQGQRPFTYNDITKYFKTGEKYRESIKKQYSEKAQYLNDLLEIYKIKVKAFKRAKNKILKEHPEFKSIEEYLQQEIRDSEFHEKSELREKINQYMAEYIIKNYDKSIQKKYEHFYWTTAEEISKEFGRPICNKNDDIQKYEQFMQAQQEYEMILKKGQLKIYEEPEFDETKYYTANTENSIELDTYITEPNSRNTGLARIIVFEGIKKHMNKFFENPNNKEIFLCSTLHKENASSKYVSEFFGLKDSLFVNRRQGRDREVHICRIPREDVEQYLTDISDKLVVLCGYNPDNKSISEDLRDKILAEDKENLKRLNQGFNNLGDRGDSDGR